jgi:hypothetical protein
MATADPSLCVSVVRSQTSIKRGQTASYVVSVWTTDGSASDVTLKLAATPSSQKAKFALGCGSKDGTAACDVGTVDSTSATRQLQAQITVASSASSVTSVKLTAKAAATDVKTDPDADASVSVTAASSSPSASPSASDTSSSAAADDDAGSDTTLPAESLPALNGSGSTYTSSAGNASGLFPTINPSNDPSPSAGTKASDKVAAEPAADTTTLPLGTPVVGAQIVGLGALAIACGLAVTRLSVRRRPAQKTPPEE